MKYNMSLMESIRLLQYRIEKTIYNASNHFYENRLNENRYLVF